MSSFVESAKRVIIGRPIRSKAAARQLLPKRLALPIYASDALSSVAYAPDEILLTLALAGSIALAGTTRSSQPTSDRAGDFLLLQLC